MREILFRGKRLDNGEWAEGDLRISHFHACGDIPERWECSICVPDKKMPWASSVYFVDPDTVGQYTGCRDRNGRRIFEGDILAFDPGEGEETSRYLVKWEDTKWILSYEDGHADDDMTNWESENWTVVGNIHDDPGLMRGAK